MVRWSYHRPVSTRDPSDEFELVVAEDGSIPADQLARLGIRPGSRLHLFEAHGPSGSAPPNLAGSLPDLPDIDWDDFQRASEQARQDHARLS